MFKSKPLGKTGVPNMAWAPDMAEMIPGRAEELAGFDAWLEHVEKPIDRATLQELNRRAYPVDWHSPGRSTPQNPFISGAGEDVSFTDITDAQTELRRIKRSEAFMNMKLRPEIMSDMRVDIKGLKNVKKMSALELLNRLKGPSKQ